MPQNFKTIDVFAGPGGLAEGFSSLRNANGQRVFDVALSVEKEPSAFSTLRLRAFTRQFAELPDSYYDYIARRISRDQLINMHRTEWAAAVRETAMLELGTESARDWLTPVIADIRESAADRAVLIGGPPCQAYSLVGRARNRGNAEYDAASDHRHFLYREYIDILEQLQPVAFVMENVKGILSAKVNGDSMIGRIMADLKCAGGIQDSYHILPLVADARTGMFGHIIRAEEFGIPQARHRVILLGIRADVFNQCAFLSDTPPSLDRSAARASVRDVLEGMPRLRSGLSRTTDTGEEWRLATMRAFRDAATACDAQGGNLADLAGRLRSYAERLGATADLPPRASTSPGTITHNRLADWLIDARVMALPNHETRGHMAGDLARYAFAATFAELSGRSPKADEFPAGLAPDHRNWESGKFADRFRVQTWDFPATTVTSHISKDGHYFIHPDPLQCRSLTVREAARLQTFPDNYFFEGNRTQQYVQVGNAVPPLLARQIAELLYSILSPADVSAGDSVNHRDRISRASRR